MRRRAIITGASSGIGKATAITLASEGVEVVLAARRLNALDEIASEIGLAGGSAHVRACDVTSRSDCEDLIQFARSLGDAVPALVNNAGYAAFGPLAEASLDGIEREIATNLLGPIALCREILPWMLENGGTIVNVLSIAAVRTIPGTGGYSAAKTGLMAFGRVLHEEYRRQGVRVTNLVVGATDTDLWKDLAFQPDKSDMLSATVVADAIRDLVLMPSDRSVDELHLYPPKGVL